MERAAATELRGGRDPLLARMEARSSSIDDVSDVYRQHHSRLKHLAAAITMDRWLAEEVVHDAFVGLQMAGAVANPAGYLQRSVVNRSISVLRRRATVRRQPDLVARPVVNPEIDETWAVVTELPARERAVVVMRYWLDLSEADIATTLGWPRGTVKSTLHRALNRLEKRLS